MSKFRVFKGKGCLHFAFFPHAQTTPRKKSKEQTFFYFFVAFKNTKLLVLK
jgi:hypothetical protein